MKKFIVLRFNIAGNRWIFVDGFDCIVKAITCYDRQLSSHPTCRFVIVNVIVESEW